MRNLLISLHYTLQFCGITSKLKKPLRFAESGTTSCFHLLQSSWKNKCADKNQVIGICTLNSQMFCMVNSHIFYNMANNLSVGSSDLQTPSWAPIQSTVCFPSEQVNFLNHWIFKVETFLYNSFFCITFCLKVEPVIYREKNRFSCLVIAVQLCGKCGKKKFEIFVCVPGQKTLSKRKVFLGYFHLWKKTVYHEI